MEPPRKTGWYIIQRKGEIYPKECVLCVYTCTDKLLILSINGQIKPEDVIFHNPVNMEACCGIQE